jgi:3-deoxy-D-manno-octulosonate cytidylyltransferase
MKVACFIPSRYESSRFQGKALADISGLPMIQRVYEQVMKAAGVSFIAVLTDDERIAHAVEGFGGQVIMTPMGRVTGTDRIAFVMETSIRDAIMELDVMDIIVNVQGDQPLIQPQHIAQVVDMLCRDEFLPMATLAYPLDINIAGDHNTVKVVTGIRGNAVYFSRAPIVNRRDTGPEYLKHLGIYGYRRWFLNRFMEMPQSVLEYAESLEQLRVIESGYTIRVGITEIDSISVDVPSDIAKVRLAMPEIGGCAG